MSLFGGFFQSAVSEAQRCFAAPLDHTRHAVEPPPVAPQPPTNTNARDPAKRSNVSVDFQSPDPKYASDGLLTGGALRPNAEAVQSTPPPRKQSSTSPWTDVSLRGGTFPSTPANDQPKNQPTSSLSVVVVGKDGTRVGSSFNLQNDTNSHSGQNDGNSCGDTLTRRTAPQALALETQRVKSSYNVGHKVNQADAVCEAEKVQDAEARASWQIGSVLEVYSASLSQWYPALVVEKSKGSAASDMLTVRFWLDIDDVKQKILSRADACLAPLGANCAGQLPPGFQTRSSKTRPGQVSYLDATTGLKYESAELAWAAHFQRWLDNSAPAGMQTIQGAAAVVVAANEPMQKKPPAPSRMDVTAAEGLVTERPPAANDMPTPSRMDGTAAQALITTEYELSRSSPKRQPGMLGQAQSADSAPAGLVTEYESDWACMGKSRESGATATNVVTSSICESLPEDSESPSTAGYPAALPETVAPTKDQANQDGYGDWMCGEASATSATTTTADAPAADTSSIVEENTSTPNATCTNEAVNAFRTLVASGGAVVRKAAPDTESTEPQIPNTTSHDADEHSDDKDGEAEEAHADVSVSDATTEPVTGSADVEHHEGDTHVSDAAEVQTVKPDALVLPEAGNSHDGTEDNELAPNASSASSVVAPSDETPDEVNAISVTTGGASALSTESCTGNDQHSSVEDSQTEQAPEVPESDAAEVNCAADFADDRIQEAPAAPADVEHEVLSHETSSTTKEASACATSGHEGSDPAKANETSCIAAECAPEPQTADRTTDNICSAHSVDETQTPFDQAVTKECNGTPSAEKGSDA